MKAEQDLTDPGVTTPPTDEQRARGVGKRTRAEIRVLLSEGFETSQVADMLGLHITVVEASK